ncbi:unnamed protein product [Chrysoparadoxa australica]
MDCAMSLCCMPCFVVQNTKELAHRKGDKPVYIGKIESNVMGRS